MRKFFASLLLALTCLGSPLLSLPQNQEPAPQSAYGRFKPIQFVIVIPIVGEEQLLDIANEQMFAHVFGRISYDDIFGKTWFTRFRYRWELVAEESDVLHWAPYGNSEDNQAT